MTTPVAPPERFAPCVTHVPRGPIRIALLFPPSPLAPGPTPWHSPWGRAVATRFPELLARTDVLVAVPVLAAHAPLSESWLHLLTDTEAFLAFRKIVTYAAQRQASLCVMGYPEDAILTALGRGQRDPLQWCRIDGCEGLESILGPLPRRLVPERRRPRLATSPA